MLAWRAVSLPRKIWATCQLILDMRELSARMGGSDTPPAIRAMQQSLSRASAQVESLRRTLAPRYPTCGVASRSSHAGTAWRARALGAPPRPRAVARDMRASCPFLLANGALDASFTYPSCGMRALCKKRARGYDGQSEWLMEQCANRGVCWELAGASVASHSFRGSIEGALGRAPARGPLGTLPRHRRSRFGN